MVSLPFQRERETFLADHTPDEGRIVSLSHDAEEPSAEQQVQLLHQALRQCLGLIQCVILKEEEEWGKMEGDYETMKNSVRHRLEFLLRTTKDLVETGGVTLEVTPDHQCNEVQRFSFLGRFALANVALTSREDQVELIQFQKGRVGRLSTDSLDFVTIKVCKKTLPLLVLWFCIWIKWKSLEH